MNAFSREYFKERLDFINNRIKTFKLKDNEFLTEDNEPFIKEGNLMLRYAKGGFTRLDGYFYKDMDKWTNFPILIDEKEEVLWMSITPMEISSHYFPIKLSRGTVGVGGLGLGYYIESIKDKEDVNEIIVFESNEDVINLYYKNFGKSDKVKIVREDVTKIKGYKFDFFYNDIYPEMLPDEIAEHYKDITSNNDISLYWFWGLERFVIGLLNDYSKEMVKTFPQDWIFYSINLYEQFLDSEYSNLYDIYPSETLYDNFMNVFKSKKRKHR